MDPSVVIFVLVNSLLSILTVTSNLLILIAVIRSSKLHIPSNILLCNLALADLLVGLVTQPTFVVSMIIDEPLKNALDLGMFIFGGVSLVGVTLVLIDRYYALSLHLRYQVVVTNRRAIMAVVGLWAISLLPLTIFLVLPNLVYITGVLGGLSCVVTSIVVYIKMYQIIKRHRTQIMAESVTSSYTVPQRGGRSKSIKTSILVQIVYILSWLPLIFVAPLAQLLKSKDIYNHYFRLSVTIFLSKSLANPALYCWRIKELRQAIIKASMKIGMACYTCVKYR